jgi:hypothetical protein
MPFDSVERHNLWPESHKHMLALKLILPRIHLEKSVSIRESTENTSFLPPRRNTHLHCVPAHTCPGGHVPGSVPRVHTVLASGARECRGDREENQKCTKNRQLNVRKTSDLELHP